MSNRSVAAHAPQAARNGIFYFGGYRLEVRERRLWQADNLITLSPKAFDLLVVMLQDAGRLLEKDYLIRTVWPDSYVQDANLSVHIASIRKALGRSSTVPQFIETVPKIGYRFVAAVIAEPDHESAATPSPASIAAELESAPGPPSSAATGNRLRSIFIVSICVAVACLTVAFGLRLGMREKTRPASAPTTRPLAGPPGLFLQPAFSPDGQQIAYTWRSSKDPYQSVYIQHVSSDDRRKLVDTGDDDYSPTWSPRGTEIALLHSRGDDQPLEIVVVNVQNPDLRRVIATICSANDPFRNPPTLSWSPDSSTLVTTDCGSGSPSLELISVSTGQKRQITHAPLRTLDDQAAFSPDGRWIAFRRTQGDSADAIYLVAADGGPERRLTWASNPIDGLAWSPDGARLLFSSGRATSLGNIWSLPVHGGSPTPVTTPLIHTSSPAVSPVGHRMAYVDSPNNASVWRLGFGAHGSLEPFITSTFFDSSAVYSPDGKRIAFRSDRSGANEIWVCNSDGSQPSELTHFDGPVTGSPRWSPDSKSLAFDSRARGRSDIYVVRVDGGQPTRVTDAIGTNSDNVVPGWSHDGKKVYFSSNRSGTWQVWAHDVETGAEAQVTLHGGFDAMETSDGSALIYIGDMDRNVLHRLSLPEKNHDEPIATLGAGLWHPWTLGDGQLYFVRRPSVSDKAVLVRLDLRSGKSQPIGDLPQAMNDSISISPDAHSVLFARRTSSNSSIMIVDGLD